MITKKENLGAKKLSTIAVLLFGGALISLGLDELLSLSVKPERLQATLYGATEEVHAPADPFLNISLVARAAYVEDITTGKVLFAQNENEKLPLASVTKLMTALVAREHMGESAVVTLSAEDIAQEGDSGLRVGERWRLGDLLDVMLLVSSNDAAHAVARFVEAQGQEEGNARVPASFVSMMNEKARALGLTSMEFFNASGLDVEQGGNGALMNTTAGGYGSAREVVLLMNELWRKYPETLEVTARKGVQTSSQDGIVHVLQNTNEATGHFLGLAASKTGFTTLAGGNLAMIIDRDIGSPVALVVLGSGYKERFEDMQVLVGAMREAL